MVSIAIRILAAFLLAQFQGDFRIHITAIFTRRVRQLGLAAFDAQRIVYRSEPMVAAAGAGPAFTGLLHW